MEHRRARRPVPVALVVAALLAGAMASSGCITRPVREVVWEDGYSTILLRSEKKGSHVVPRGFQHPATIAPIRLTNILSRIDMRQAEGRREPAVPTDLLYKLGDKISDALKKANPNQEVVVQAVRRSKRMGIFDRLHLTSMLVYMKNDLLYIQVSRVDWEIPPRREDRLPETHAGEFPLDHRLLPDTAMVLADPQTVAVQWKDPIFQKATRIRLTGTGKVVRREVLMEDLEDDTVFEPEPQLPDVLSPAQLRALADLEEARQRGEVTESEYTVRRKEILSGDL